MIYSHTYYSEPVKNLYVCLILEAFPGHKIPQVAGLALGLGVLGLRPRYVNVRRAHLEFHAGLKVGTTRD